MKYVIFPEFRNNRQQNGLFTNLGEHSKGHYFTVKGFHIKKVSSLVELGKFVFLTKAKIPKITK